MMRMSPRLPLRLLCAGLAAAGIFFLPLLPFFCLYERGDPCRLLLPGKPPLSAALARAITRRIPDTRFVISYTHSVNKGRVKDFYIIGPDRTILVEKTRFSSYGAGIPEPEEGNDFTVADGYIEIGNLNRPIQELVVRVGVVANHAVEFEGREFFLADYFKPQTAVKIEYRNISLVDYICSKK